MASIYREFDVAAAADAVWQAIRDVGAVHLRLARGFVTDTRLEGDVRTVTFSNGFVVQEQIVAIDDAHRRLAYCAKGGRASHHNAYFQVFGVSENASRILWVTDLLPEDAAAPVGKMVDAGIEAMKMTLASPAA